MKKKIVGIVGWRGMVGSVLISRMIQENDFNYFKSIFFSTSQFGTDAPLVKNLYLNKLQNAYDIDSLMDLDIIITCQGSNYTNFIYPQLIKKKWNGYWIDAASLLRTNEDSVIVLDPVNKNVIDMSLEKGLKTFIGGNCTVSLMLMALGGLFKEKLIEWISVSTYQAASGAGSKHMLELLSQMGYLYDSVRNKLKNKNCSILDIERLIANSSNEENFPKNNFKVPLASNLIPWIDIELRKKGQSKEEWKGQFETNKILGINKNRIIKIDGICVRIGSFRCHSQFFTIKLNKNIFLSDIENILSNHNSWVKIISNNRDETIKKLTPCSVTGSLDIPIGRIRKMNIGSKYLSAFSVGDQLLWGAAEPLRRILRIILLS
ncbi:Aspartate-semialdehyde dehydrogenase [Buchnera aphidicola (Tetraneura ulmi)]|uniref:aspartate-semialdehyde dehydrogenase n=1 Tax=Buchnera aphidicola TaxID=9 RepID=UPI003464E69E